jgi:CysZ protein
LTSFDFLSIFTHQKYRLLKELVIAIQSYGEAHRFIKQHRLWKWILIPGIIYTLLFIVGIYFFWISADNAIDWIGRHGGWHSWLQKQRSQLLSFFAVMIGIVLRLILLLFYFSLFKYLFLIIGSPVFAYLSEKTASIIEEKEFPFSFKQLIKDAGRGAVLAVRNTVWQTVYLVALFLLSFVPVAGWIAPVIALLVEGYYYGFSMLDYSCERAKLSPAQSISFIGRHRGLAIGNGVVFYLMHSLIIVGWIAAPAYAVVAATLSLHRVKNEPLL